MAGRIIGLSLVTAAALLIAAGFGARALWTVPVPTLEVASVDVARAKAEAAGLSVFVARESENPLVAAGNVISQAPAAGARVMRGAVVLLEVSAGAHTQATVPDVAGLDFKKAREAIVAAGLQMGEVLTVRSGKQPPGHAVSTDPEAGAELERGGDVDVTLSMGQEKVKVPRVTGRSVSRARRVLSQVGLKVGAVKRRSSEDHAFGIIYRQLPAAGSMLAIGGSVRLTVSVESYDDDD